MSDIYIINDNGNVYIGSDFELLHRRMNIPAGEAKMRGEISGASDWVIPSAFPGYKDRRAHAVICVETGITYPSITDASRATGIRRDSISRCCKGDRKTAGKLHWKFYG